MFMFLINVCVLGPEAAAEAGIIMKSGSDSGLQIEFASTVE